MYDYVEVSNSNRETLLVRFHVISLLLSTVTTLWAIYSIDYNKGIQLNIWQKNNEWFSYILVNVKLKPSVAEIFHEGVASLSSVVHNQIKQNVMPPSFLSASHIF